MQAGRETNPRPNRGRRGRLGDTYGGLVRRRLPVGYVVLAVLAAVPLYLVVFWPFGPPDLPSGCPYLPAQTLSDVVPAAQRIDTATVTLPDRVSCGWESTGQATGQSAAVTLTLTVVRSTATAYRGAGRADAQSTFVKAETSGSYGPHHVYDLPGLGDSAFAVIVDNTGPALCTVTVAVLRGIDVYTVIYSAVPTSRELALAAAVVVTRDLITSMESTT
jgi:hypothetical protein